MLLSDKYPFLTDYFTRALEAENHAIPQSILFYGSDFNAVDVLHTINLIRYNETNYTSLLSCISAASCPDNYTLSVTFSRAVPNPEAILSFPVVQNSVTTENLADYIPIGTGPYKYYEKSTSNKIRLTVNEMWRENIPSIAEIDLNILGREQP